MATKHDLQDWVLESLRRRGGSAHLIDVAKDIWEQHEDDLRDASDDLFFSWQYDMRWACTALRKSGHVKPHSKKGVWQLA